nr:DUF6044 family protein [Bacillus subtilis]
MRQQKKETYYLWIALFLLLLYVSPLFILKEDAHIRVHDNLDSNIAWYKVLVPIAEKSSARLTLPFPKSLTGCPGMPLAPSGAELFGSMLSFLP